MHIDTRNVLIRKLPTFIKNKLRILRDKYGLLDLGSDDCDVSNLRSLNKQDINEIFSSDDIGKQWNGTNNLIRSIEVKAGGVNKGDRRAIYYLAKAVNANSVLEIGTHVGCSTISFAAAMIGPKKQKKLITVDIRDVNDPVRKPWSYCGSQYSPRELISKIGADDFVKFKVRTSLDYLRNCKEKFDIIFLDGDHAARTVYQEIPLALKLLNPEGLILLHDYFPNNGKLWPNENIIPGPFLAVQKLMEKNQDLSVLPLGTLPWKTRSNSNTTSLALLTRSAKGNAIVRGSLTNRLICLETRSGAPLEDISPRCSATIESNSGKNSEIPEDIEHAFSIMISFIESGSSSARAIHPSKILILLERTSLPR